MALQIEQKTKNKKQKLSSVKKKIAKSVMKKRANDDNALHRFLMGGGGESHRKYKAGSVMGARLLCHHICTPSIVFLFPPPRRRLSFFFSFWARVFGSNTFAAFIIIIIKGMNKANKNGDKVDAIGVTLLRFKGVSHANESKLMDRYRKKWWWKSAVWSRCLLTC